MKRIEIAKDFKEDYVSRVAGEKLRKKIVSISEKVIIDFGNIKVASSSFFDEGIAKLVEDGWDSDTLNSRLLIKNINRFDKELLNLVCIAKGIELDWSLLNH